MRGFDSHPRLQNTVAGGQCPVGGIKAQPEIGAIKARIPLGFKITTL
jgi:hypothetical protein